MLEKGFNGETKPNWVCLTSKLGAVHLHLLQSRDVSNVMVQWPLQSRGTSYKYSTVVCSRWLVASRRRVNLVPRA